jgi:hypothetical protein
MTFKSGLTTIPVTVALLGAALFSSPPRLVAAMSEELSPNPLAENAVTEQLRELRILTGELNNDADRLNALVFSRLHWQTHADNLRDVKDHVNRIGAELGTLQDMRDTAAPWQQEAIDRIIPVAIQVADRTTSAIDHLRENRLRLWAPEYIDHLRSISSLSDKMHGLLDNHLKMIDVRDNLQRIENKLTERVS